MKKCDAFSASERTLGSESCDLVEDTASVFEGQRVSVVGKHGDFVLFWESIHVCTECSSEHISVFFGVCNKCAPKPCVSEMPIKV